MNRLILLSVLLTATLAAKAQTALRPYNQWEATQFVAVSSHQPSDYVLPDNNWEIVYALRTPHTLAELRDSGISCTDSQLLLLEVGGLIAAKDGRWKTTIPILDEAQTRSLRSFAEQVAQTIYEEAKPDFIALTKIIRKAGYGNNAFSLLFSYLLDGRMWTQLVLFGDIENHTTWSGCYWVLYEPRSGLACGTNSYGEQDLILTYVDSSITPGTETMDRYADEIARQGRLTDAALISSVQPFGLADAQGLITIPVIGTLPAGFHRLNERLVAAISTELKRNCTFLTARFGIGDENTAMVMLYHEVMWGLTDRLIRDGIISVPAIFTDRDANKHRLHEVVFYVEGGLMQ